jgi:ethanolamine utilization protein EutM
LKAIGILETRGLVAGITASDAMLKAADVSLVNKEVTSPALVSIIIEGEVAAVKSAIDAGQLAANSVGELVSTLVIPRPAQGLSQTFSRMNTEISVGENKEDYSTLTVAQLRKLARSIENFPLKGRDISQANKTSLLQLLRNLQK